MKNIALLVIVAVVLISPAALLYVHVDRSTCVCQPPFRFLSLWQRGYYFEECAPKYQLCENRPTYERVILWYIGLFDDYLDERWRYTLILPVS